MTPIVINYGVFSENIIAVSECFNEELVQHFFILGCLTLV